MLRFKVYRWVAKFIILTVISISLLFFYQYQGKDEWLLLKIYRISSCNSTIFCSSFYSTSNTSSLTQPQYFAQPQMNYHPHKTTIPCTKANPKWWWDLLCKISAGKPEGVPADLYVGTSFTNELFPSRANLCAPYRRFESKCEWKV